MHFQGLLTRSTRQRNDFTNTNDQYDKEWAGHEQPGGLSRVIIRGVRLRTKHCWVEVP